MLSTAAARGATVASVHPLKTFADASAAVLTFNGSRCAAEGDAAALSVLQPAFERIGAQVFAINALAKTLYHAASVMMCNYLTALLETGARSFEAAGLPRDEAMRMVEPLVRETLAFHAPTVRPCASPHHVASRRLRNYALPSPAAPSGSYTS